jgi:putative membrane protein
MRNRRKGTWAQGVWLAAALRLQGSVVPEVVPRAIFCGLVGEGIFLIHHSYVRLSLPFLSSLIPNLVLGLLLVFRTNTAYERFWEGRKAWGGLVNCLRNLARMILVAIAEPTPEDRRRKERALRLLPAFAIAMKQFLRTEPIGAEMEPLLQPWQYQQLQTVNHPPLKVAYWISHYLHQEYQQGHLDRYQLTTMQELMGVAVDVLGACERIKKTPIPLAYSIHLKQLLLIYCLTLPFQVVDQVGWGTGVIVAIISFTLLGIEEIGLQIEDPFGYDPNDLPLDGICQTIVRNLEDLIVTTSPQSLPTASSPELASG